MKKSWHSPLVHVMLGVVEPHPDFDGVPPPDPVVDVLHLDVQDDHKNTDVLLVSRALFSPPVMEWGTGETLPPVLGLKGAAESAGRRPSGARTRGIGLCSPKVAALRGRTRSKSRLVKATAISHSSSGQRCVCVMKKKQQQQSVLFTHTEYCYMNMS